MSKDDLLSNMCITLSKTSNRVDRQERPDLNPCRVLLRQPFWSRKENTCFLLILSMAGKSDDNYLSQFYRRTCKSEL